MIVFVPDCQGTWWIDTTNKDIDPVLPTPSPLLVGRQALILDKDNPRLMKMPEWDYASSDVALDRSMEIASDGTISEKQHGTFRGFSAFEVRSVIRPVDQEAAMNTSSDSLAWIPRMSPPLR